MIQITLTFNTIAQAVAALREIPENDLAQAPVIEAAPVKEKAAGKPPALSKQAAPAPAVSEPVAEAPVSAPAVPAASTASVEPKADVPEVKAEPVAEEAPLEYSVLQKAVFTLASKDKAAALAVNTSLGVKSMKELPASRWREALAAVEAKLAALEEAVA
jgi:hypothetical protein